jgi:cytochrome b6-f complex iron-sulfur subunit
MMTRRRFLSLTGSLMAGGLLAGCMSQESGEPEVQEVLIAPGDVPQPGGAPLRNQPGRFFLINNEDGLLALYTKCTHQGCMVDWEGDEDRFHCPCHGSIFDRHGEVTSGPAGRPLDLMIVRVQQDGGVLVVTGPITKREEWEPSQSVQA